MWRVLVLIVFVVQLSGCSWFNFNRGMVFNYSGYKFIIPLQPDLIISPENESENLLIFQYNSSSGSKYLGFHEVSQEFINDKYCKDSEFLRDVFNGSKNSRCDKEKLRSFAATQFEMNGVRKGFYKVRDTDVYFVISDRKSSLFLCKIGKRIVRIDSDFLTEDELNSIAKNMK